MSIFRRDPITGRWTIMRPDPNFAPPRRVQLDETTRDFCPFCPGSEKNTLPHVVAFPEKGPWRVRVIPNKFPILHSDLRPDPATSGIYDRLGGFGVHEVVVESSDHHGDFARLSVEHTDEILAAWLSRSSKLAEDKRIRYVLIFRNRGTEAGSSIEHPHSQIIGLPIVPKLVMDENAAALRYYQWKERCVFCDMITDELTQGLRIVEETERFVAFVPYAARFPYETWILPKTHAAHFSSIAADERKELAKILRSTLRKVDRTLETPPFNLILHTAPSQEGDLTHYHWHIEIMPRLVETGAFEWGTGFYVNPVLPEDAVRQLTAKN